MLSIALAATDYLCVAPHCIKEHVRCKRKDGLNLTKWTISYRRGYRSGPVTRTSSALCGLLFTNCCNFSRVKFG